jgi:hypothetical protein
MALDIFDIKALDYWERVYSKEITELTCVQEMAAALRSADSAGYARGVSSATDAMLAARTGEKA